jgi:hypothetical protein
MRRIGNALLAFGVVVGVLSGLWLWMGPTAGGLPWLVGIGLIKLTFTAGLALMATGAVGLRLANRKLLEERKSLEEREVLEEREILEEREVLEERKHERR